VQISAPLYAGIKVERIYASQVNAIGGSEKSEDLASRRWA